MVSGMNANIRKVLTLIGLTLVAVGVVHGFLPVGRCGSAFASNGLAPAGCRELVSDASRWSVQLILGGALLAMGAHLTFAGNSDAKPPVSS